MWCFRWGRRYFGQGLSFSVFWACQAPSILGLLHCDSLNLVSGPIILFACQNNTRSNEILVDFIHPYQLREDNPNTQRHRHETSFGIRPYGDARIW
jgi:hypothetical protein